MTEDFASDAALERELRREAAEILSRSRWWYEERLREELLSREWYRPRQGGTGELGEDRLVGV
jgi:hypothetical protein